MKKLILLSTLFIIALKPAFAQNNLQKQDSSKLVMAFNPYDRQDTLGRKFLLFLKDYEKLGHLNMEGQTAGNSAFIKEFKTLFKPDATLPNDLGKDLKVKGIITLDAYSKMALDTGFRAYSLVIETRDFILSRTSIDQKFKTQLRVLKIFNEKAAIGKAYLSAAIYELEIEMDWNVSRVKIIRIKHNPDKAYYKFRLGNIGLIKNTELASANNLEGLIQKYEPPKPKRTKSKMLLFGSYIMPNYLQPKEFSNNLNNNTQNSFQENGWAAGIHIQMPIDNKGKFRLMFGAAIENNSYSNLYNNLNFEYTQDCDGNPLVDKEGEVYDRKYVAVSEFKEEGNATYLKPELGVELHLNQNKTFGLQLNTALGYSYPLVTSYTTQSNVTYQGQKNGFGPPISGDHLGFYTDLNKEVQSTYDKAPAFFMLNLGASVSINLSKNTAVVLGASYNTSLSPAFKVNGNNCAFLDPENDMYFESRLNNLQEDKYYQSISASMGLRFTLGANKD